MIRTDDELQHGVFEEFSWEPRIDISKITVLAQNGIVTLIGFVRKYSGWAEKVAELERLFEAEGKDHRVVLDLKEVKLVDRDAVRFLARCEAKGIWLEDCPAYIREWIVREGPRTELSD